MKNLARAAIFLTALGWGAAAVFGAESRSQTIFGSEKGQESAADPDAGENRESLEGMTALAGEISQELRTVGRVQVSCGTEGTVKDCRSFPVELQLSQWPAGSYQAVLETVTDSGMSFDLETSLSKLFLADGNATDQSKICRYRREIGIGEDGEAQVNFQLTLPFYGGNFRWMILDQEEQELSSGVVNVESPRENEIYTAVLSGDTDLEPALQQLRFTGENGGNIMNLKTISWEASQVPEDQNRMDQLQVFVAQEGQLEGLSQQQREVLERWESQGGLLIETTEETLKEDVEQMISGERLDRLIQENGNSYSGWEKSNVLENAPIRSTPPVKLYLGILLLYIVIAGPGLYLILKKKNRRYYLFGGILAASLTTVLLLAVLGHRNGIHAPFLVYEARYVQKGEKTSLQATCGIQAPYNGGYTLYVDPDYQLLPYQPYSALYWDGEEQMVGFPSMDMRLGEKSSRLQFSDVSTFQPMYFTLERQEEGGALVEAQVSCFQETLQGTVTNRSPYVISDAQLLLGREGVAYLGDLQPGQTVSLENIPVIFASQETWLDKIGENLQQKDRNWEKFLELQYQQIYYQWTERADRTGGMLLGFVEDGTLDFQMDSGYEVYGKSVLQAEIPVELTREGAVYDPWFADRGKNGHEDYATTLGMYINQGETQAQYQVEGTLERLRFISRESLKTAYEIPFTGEVSLFNWQTEKYDLLEDWESRTLVGNELAPYVSPDTGLLQVRYQTEQIKEKEDGNEVLELLPVITAVERKVPDA